MKLTSSLTLAKRVKRLLKLTERQLKTGATKAHGTDSKFYELKTLKKTKQLLNLKQLILRRVSATFIMKLQDSERLTVSGFTAKDFFAQQL